ncbi:hypothetical protein ACPC54_18640 [Kitasatospora sp. NPDC094028]
MSSAVRPTAATAVMLGLAVLPGVIWWPVFTPYHAAGLRHAGLDGFEAWAAALVLPVFGVACAYTVRDLPRRGITYLSVLFTAVMGVFLAHVGLPAGRPGNLGWADSLYVGLASAAIAFAAPHAALQTWAKARARAERGRA